MARIKMAALMLLLTITNCQLLDFYDYLPEGEPV